MTLIEFLVQHATWYPDKTAVVCAGRRRTWSELNRQSNRVAHGLRELGIRLGDRVAVVSQNCIEYPEMLLGILKAGAAIVPVSTLLRRDTVCAELKDAGVKAIFAAQPFLPLVPEYEPSCVRIALEGVSERAIGYEEFLRPQSDAEPDLRPSPDDPFNIVYSSGTTGTPKGIVHTHQARVFFALTCGLEFRIHNEAVSLISTPLYSNGTLLTFLPTLLVGGTMVLMRAFDPVAFLDLVEKEKCTHAFLVPTQFIRIMEHPEFSRYDTSAIELLVSAAAPLARKTKEQILVRFPKAKLAELYGLTEGISTVLRPNEQFSKPGSVGKPRLGGDIKIIDEEGNELPRGETGEVVGTNPSMMTGYFGQPEKSKEALWRDRQGRAYIKTGDIGRLDEDGYLYILDRKKDVIISGGINIFPSDIESVLRMHPDVAEAAVIGVPHREWGETPIAFVVKNNLESGLSEIALKEWANRRLAGYQKLDSVQYRASLPRNDLGKILKTELREGVAGSANSADSR